MTFPVFSYSPSLGPLFCFHLDVLSGPSLHTVLPHDYTFLFVSSPTSSRLLHRMRFPFQTIAYLSLSPLFGKIPYSTFNDLSQSFPSLLISLHSLFSSFPGTLASLLYHPSLSTYVTLSSRSAIYFSVAGFCLLQ